MAKKIIKVVEKVKISQKQNEEPKIEKERIETVVGYDPDMPLSKQREFIGKV